MHARGWRFGTAGGFCLLLLLANSAAADDTSFSLIQRGQYLVKAGDCAACHTERGGQPFAGGLAVPTPFGNIYSTNITPDKETGIGDWSEQDFYRAMHDGLTRDGEHLYPAMPYPWYTKMTRGDVGAVKAYLDTLKPVRQKNRPPGLPWPMSWRGSMAAWNTLYFKSGEFKPVAGRSSQWNRGAYLVEGLGHCGACHTPKNMLGGDKKDSKLLGGDSGEHWFAPDLSGDLHDGLGGWSKQNIIEYLKTGSTAKTAAAGQMAQVVKDSTQYLSEDDLDAIATYLMNLPVRRQKAVVANVDMQSRMRGEALYTDNCIGCHMQHGEGLAHVFPSLANSPTVRAPKADSLIHIIVTGGQRPATSQKPAAFAMPSFATKLDDGEIADIVTFIRNAWGNHAPQVSADTVAQVRKDVQKSPGS